MGLTIDTNEVLTQVARVRGVRAVNGLGLFRRSGEQWLAAPTIELTTYQLPEILGVHAQAGTDPAPPPPPDGSPPIAPSSVPTPVIPELC